MSDRVRATERITIRLTPRQRLKCKEYGSGSVAIGIRRLIIEKFRSGAADLKADLNRGWNGKPKA